MTKRIITILLLIILALSVSSCSTTEKEQPTTSSEEKTEYIDGQWTLVKSTYDHSRYNAVNFFAPLSGAAGDGQIDDTEAINSALNKAAAHGGAVYLPKGTYLVSGEITIPKNVSLIGDFVSPASKNSVKDGTVLLVAKSEKTLASPLITLSDNSSVFDISVVYKDQDPEAVTEYPYTIYQSSGNSASVVNFAAINAYKGICFSSATSENIRIENVYMSALKEGLNVQNCSEKLTIRNISLTPIYWINYGLNSDKAAALNTYLQQNLSAVSICCTSDVFMASANVDSALVGLHVDQPSTSKKSILISNYNSSDVTVSAEIESCSSEGMAFAFSSFRTTGLSNTFGVYFSPSFTSSASFNSCSFSGRSDVCINSEGSGFISAVNCTFSGWRTAAVSSSDIAFTSAKNEYMSDGRLDRISENSVALFADDSIFSEPWNATGLSFYKDSQCEYDPIKFDTGMFASSVIPRAVSDKIFNLDNYLDGRTFDEAFAKACNDASSCGGTIFIPAGFYESSSTLEVKPGVRVQGVGNGTNAAVSTIIMSKADTLHSDNIFNLKNNSSVCDITVMCPQPEAENIKNCTIRAFAASNATNVFLSDISVINAGKAAVLTNCTNACISRVYAETATRGIELKDCNNIDISDIAFDLKYDIDNILGQARRSFFRAVDITDSTGVSVSDISHDSGKITLFFNSEEILLIDDEQPSCTVCGVFSDNVSITIDVAKFEHAAVINAASRHKDENSSSYHIYASEGNTGKIAISNMIATGNVTEFIHIKSGECTISSCIINSSGNKVLYSSAASTDIIGSLILNKDWQYHVYSEESAVTRLLGNVLLSNREWNGPEEGYLKKYAEQGTLYVDDLNIKPYDVMDEGSSNPSADHESSF